MTPLEKFDKWFSVPISKIDDSDAAYLLLIPSFALFERFIDSRIHTEKDKLRVRRMDRQQKNELFFNLSIQELGMTDLQLFKDFWDMYRNGLAHSFQPMEIERDGRRYVSAISRTESFLAIPQYETLSEDTIRIYFDPWKWIDKVIGIWRNRADILDALPRFPFGGIFEESRQR